MKKRIRHLKDDEPIGAFLSDLRCYYFPLISIDVKEK